MMKILLISSSLFLIFMMMKFLKMLIHNFIFLLIPLTLMNMNINNLYTSKFYYIYGLDSMNLNLIILSLWIINLSLMSNYKFLFKKFNLNFMLIMMSLLMTLIMCFSSMNMFMFYIFFETSLIPMMLIIMGWGMQIDRIQASMYMLIYTLFGSLPLLMTLIMLINKTYSNSFIFLTLNNNLMINNFYMFISLFLGFLIKTPMYFTHLWLPKAHVEAPVSGSMILAGIMLKLGSYGIYRLILMFNFLTMKYSFILISLMLMGSILSSLICLIQNDMKIIVAYSSIVHMNMMIASMLSLSLWSLKGSLMMMISHGLCSSAMFFMVNLMYERSHTRNININKGMISIYPSMSMWWFLICSSNFSVPPSLNLFSEIMLINGLMSWLKLNMIYIFSIMLLSTYYSIYLFYSTQHGLLFNMFNVKHINSFNYLIIKLHWIPLNLMFLNMSMF